MGDRGQVHIVDEDVWLYTHWGASELVDDVKAALAKKWRWSDPEYLARIIFCQMLHGDLDGETGYGIGREKHGDVWRVVEINCEKQTVTVKDNEDYEDKKVSGPVSFEAFVDDYTREVALA